MPRTKTPKPPVTPVVVRSWRVEVPGYTPTSLNRLMGHWRMAHDLKMRDARLIEQACSLAGVPRVGLTKGERKARRAANIKGRLPQDPEPRKRHVRLEITLGKGQRTPDEDNLFKALLDGLKSAGMLFEDSRNWCSHDSAIAFHRGKTKDDRMTVVHLEEFN